MWYYKVVICPDLCPPAPLRAPVPRLLRDMTSGDKNGSMGSMNCRKREYGCVGGGSGEEGRRAAKEAGRRGSCRHWVMSIPRFVVAINSPDALAARAGHLLREARESPRLQPSATNAHPAAVAVGPLAMVNADEVSALGSATNGTEEGGERRRSSRATMERFLAALERGFYRSDGGNGDAGTGAGAERREITGGGSGAPVARAVAPRATVGEVAAGRAGHGSVVVNEVLEERGGGGVDGTGARSNERNETSYPAVGGDMEGDEEGWRHGGVGTGYGGGEEGNEGQVGRRKPDPTHFSFWLAANLPLDDSARQELLDMDSVVSRLRLDVSGRSRVVAFRL